MNGKLLKRFVGEAAALLDDSNGADNLYDILKELVDGVSDNVNGFQAVVATGVIASMVMDRASVLRSLVIDIGTAGTAGTTTVQVRVNGVSAGSLSIGNAETDGTFKTLSLDVALAIGDVVDLNVSAAPTGGANLTATARARPCKAE